MLKKMKIKLASAACIGFLCLIAPVYTAFAAGTLSIALSSSDAKVGDTVTVTVYAAGADNAEVTADMNITYDTSKLEYVSSSSSNASGGGGTVKVSGSDVSLKFKAVGSGDAYVKAEGATLTAAGAHISVSGTASSEENAQGEAKSGDNSLSSLTISNGTLSPAFKGSVTEYTAEVGSDVSEIQVSPVLSNSKAEVVSVTGNQGLKAGKNVITILVRAENGTEASYKITVTKGEGAASDPNQDQAAPSDGTDGQGQEGTNAPADPSGTGMIEIDGVSYSISDEFSDADIPAGFSRANFEYKGTPHVGVIFDAGHVGMYYMASEAGDKKFFIYDSDRDRFYPYVRLSSGEHFIILMVVPNGVIPPDNYEEATLAIGDVSNIPAYQYVGGEDTEIVKLETEDGEVTEGNAADFYLFYGIDAEGAFGWYQYDIKQGTYQRFNEAVTGSASPSESYQTLAKSYKELDERQRETKAKDRRLIAVLIFVAVVLLIVVINLLLKIRDLKSEDDEDGYEELPKKKAKPVVSRKAQKPARPVKPARPAKEPKQEENPYFYGDDDDMMDEFEDDPSVLGRRPKKKEKPQRKQDLAKSEPVTLDEDDDDIEFIDLNDL